MEDNLVRKVLVVFMLMWAVFHVIMIIKLSRDFNWLLAVLMLPAVAVNILGLIKIYNYYRAK